MTGRIVPRGILFYFGDRRREEVIFDAELRALTLALIEAMQRAVALGDMPAHTPQRVRCNGCSLYDVCLPKEIEQYLAELQR
jgi:CRISPR-associated exonuclease Cas4